MSDTKITPPNPIAMITPLLVGGAVLLFYLAVSTGNPMMIASVLAAPLVLLLPGRLSLCFTLLFMLGGAHIYIPGFISELTMLDFFGALVLGILVARRALVSSEKKKRIVAPWLFVVFLGLLVVTIYARGLGFRRLGGSQVGGMSYARLFVVCGLYLFSGSIRLNRREWKRALVGFCLIAFLPAISDLVYVLSGGRIYQLYALVRPQGAVLTTLDVFESGMGILRFKRLPTKELLLLGLVLFPWGRGHRLVNVVFGAVAFVFAGLTGFRLRLLDLSLFLGMIGYLRSRNRRILLFLKIGAVAVAMLVVLVLFASKLPLATQRTVSWIPFVSLSDTARASALGSTDWRLQLWRHMLEMIPRYLVIGRGLAFELSPYSAILNQVGLDRYNVGWAILTHNYHNGPLGLLVDLGALGLILPTFMFGLAAWRFYRFSQLPWSDGRMQWFFCLLYSKFLVSLFVFYFVYGDIRDMFPQMLYTVMFLEIMLRSRDEAHAAAEAVPES